MADAPRVERGASAARANVDRTFFVLGALLAFFGVAGGAFGAHVLSSRLAPERMVTFETGVRYQMYHAFALLILAWATTRWPVTLLHTAGWLFVAGIVLFSGSLYALAFGAPRLMGAITPFGGLSFLLGWLLALLAVARS